MRPGPGIGLGVHHQRIGIRPVGDPHLAAVQNVVVAALLRPRPHPHHVRSGAALAHRQRAHELAADQLGQEAPLLLLVAVPIDLIDAQIAVRPIRQPHAGARPADLLERHAMLEIPHRRAAILLAGSDAEHAERTHLAPEVGGEIVGPIDVGGARGDLVMRERLDAGAQHVGGLAELEVQRRRPVRKGCRHRGFPSLRLQ